MAEKSGLWDGVITGDALAIAPYDGDEFALIWETFFGSGQGGAENKGVIDSYLNELEVTGASSPVAVNTGGALVKGRWYRNDVSVNVSISTPAADTRTDRIILRSSWAAKTIRIVGLENGSEGTGTPPALTQTDGTTWEIPLATLTVTTGGVITVSDTREFIHIGASRTQYILVAANGGLNVTDATEIIHGNTLGCALTDAKVCDAYGHFVVPTDFVDNMSVKTLISTIVGVTGNFYGTLTVEWGACGEAPDNDSDSTGPSAIAIPLAAKLNCILEVTPTTADLTGGDIVTLTLQRDAVDALDTIGSSFVYCAGFLVSYTADN